MKFFADAILGAPLFLLLAPPGFNGFARTAELVNRAPLGPIGCDSAFMMRRPGAPFRASTMERQRPTLRDQQFSLRPWQTDDVALVVIGDVDTVEPVRQFSE